MALEQLGISAVAAGVPGFVQDLGRMDRAIAGVGTRGESLGRQFVNLGSTVVRFGTLLTTAVVGAAAAAGTALTAIATVGIREAADAERVNAKLEAVLAATGGAAGITAERARELADQLRDLAGGSDEAVLAAEAVLLRFKAIKEEAFEPALRTTLDLAAVLGVDAATAAAQLGRALELPGEGLRVLKAAGIVLTDEQRDLVDQLVESGQIAEAQTFLLDALATSIGGTAARAADTFGGRLTILRGHILEQAEAIGFVLLPQLNRLFAGITPIIEQALPLLVELFRDRIGPAVDRTVSFLLNLIDTIRDAGVFSLEFREALLSLLPPALQDRITEFTDQVVESFTKLRDFVIENKDAIIAAIQGIGAALAAAAIVATILKIVAILSSLTSTLGIVLLVIGLLKAAWETNFLGIRDILTDFWETTGRPIFDQVVEFFETNIPRAIAFVQGLFTGDLGPALGDTAGRFQPLIDQVIRLVNIFQEQLPTVLAVGKDIVAFIGGTFGPTLDVVLANLTILISNFADAWERDGEKVISFVGGFVKVIVATIEGALILLTGILAAWTSLVSGDFQGAFDALSETLTRFFENALAVVGTNLDEFLATWQGVFDNLAIIITTAFGNIIDGIASFIEDLGAGLIGGIEDVVGGLADFLGLGSPSRLFEGIGQQMMAGLARGISGASPLPTVAVQAAAAQAAAGTGRTMTNNFNQTINTSAPREPIMADFQMMVAQSERVSRRF